MHDHKKADAFEFAAPGTHPRPQKARRFQPRSCFGQEAIDLVDLALGYVSKGVKDKAQRAILGPLCAKCGRSRDGVA